MNHSFGSASAGTAATAQSRTPLQRGRPSSSTRAASFDPPKHFVVESLRQVLLDARHAGAGGSVASRVAPRKWLPANRAEAILSNSRRSATPGPVVDPTARSSLNPAGDAGGAEKTPATLGSTTAARSSAEQAELHRMWRATLSVASTACNMVRAQLRRAALRQRQRSDGTDPLARLAALSHNDTRGTSGGSASALVHGEDAVFVASETTRFAIHPGIANAVPVSEPFAAFLAVTRSPTSQAALPSLLCVSPPTAAPSDWYSFLDALKSDDPCRIRVLDPAFARDVLPIILGSSRALQSSGFDTKPSSIADVVPLRILNASDDGHGARKIVTGNVVLCSIDGCNGRLVVLGHKPLTPALGPLYSVITAVSGIIASESSERVSADVSDLDALETTPRVSHSRSAASEIVRLYADAANAFGADRPHRDALCVSAITVASGETLPPDERIVTMGREQSALGSSVARDFSSVVSASVSQSKRLLDSGHHKLLRTVLTSVEEFARTHLRRVALPVIDLRLRRRSRHRLLLAHASSAPKLTGAVLARHVRMLADWPRELLDSLAAKATLHVAAHGEIVRYAGTPSAAGIIIVASGFLDVESREVRFVLPHRARSRSCAGPLLLTPDGGAAGNNLQMRHSVVRFDDHNLHAAFSLGLNSASFTSAPLGLRHHHGMPASRRRTVTASLGPMSSAGSLQCVTGERLPFALRAVARPAAQLVAHVAPEDSEFAALGPAACHESVPPPAPIDGQSPTQSGHGIVIGRTTRSGAHLIAVASGPTPLMDSSVLNNSTGLGIAPPVPGLAHSSAGAPTQPHIFAAPYVPLSENDSAGSRPDGSAPPPPPSSSGPVVLYWSITAADIVSCLIAHGLPDTTTSRPRRRSQVLHASSSYHADHQLAPSASALHPNSANHRGGAFDLRADRLPSLTQQAMVTAAFEARSRELPLWHPLTPANLKASFSIFSTCSDLTLDRLAATARPLSLPKGTTLIEHGTQATRLYLLVAGRCGVFRDIGRPTTANTSPGYSGTSLDDAPLLVPPPPNLGRLQHIETRSAPAELGTEPVLFSGPYTTTVALLMNCDFYVLTRSDLEAVFMLQGNTNALVTHNTSARVVQAQAAAKAMMEANAAAVSGAPTGVRGRTVSASAIGEHDAGFRVRRRALASDDVNTQLDESTITSARGAVDAGPHQPSPGASQPRTGPASLANPPQPGEDELSIADGSEDSADGGAACGVTSDTQPNAAELAAAAAYDADTLRDEWLGVVAQASHARQAVMRKAQAQCRPFLSGLPFIGPYLARHPSDAQALLDKFTPKQYQPGELIASCSAYATKVVILVEGRVQIGSRFDVDADTPSDETAVARLWGNVPPQRNASLTPSERLRGAIASASRHRPSSASGRPASCTTHHYFAPGENIGATCVVTHRWSKMVVARSVTRVIELAKDDYVTALKRLGLYASVRRLVEALLFPNACGDPHLLLEAASAVANMQTVPTYPVSDATAVTPLAEGFGALPPLAAVEGPAVRAQAPVPSADVAEAAKRAQRELRQLQRDRLSTRLQLESAAAASGNHVFATLLMQDVTGTVATVTRERSESSAVARPMSAGCKGAGQAKPQWTRGRALIVRSVAHP
jgi:CRP-like cAMP-binding protein